MFMKFPIANPRTSRENKTGDWRSFKPILHEEKCIKCGLCQSYCPEGCISGLENKNIAERQFPKTDYDYCKGCGICANECPKKAIDMVQEEK